MPCYIWFYRISVRQHCKNEIAEIDTIQWQLMKHTTDTGLQTSILGLRVDLLID